MSAILPDRADGVDDPFGRQFVALGDSCLASRAPAQLSAFLEQLRSGGVMDGAIHPAAAEQGRVGGVDNCIHLLLGDVTFDDPDPIRNGFFAHRSLSISPITEAKEKASNSKLQAPGKLQATSSKIAH